MSSGAGSREMRSLPAQVDVAGAGPDAARDLRAGAPGSDRGCARRVAGRAGSGARPSVVRTTTRSAAREVELGDARAKRRGDLAQRSSTAGPRARSAAARASAVEPVEAGEHRQVVGERRARRARSRRPSASTTQGPAAEDRERRGHALARRHAQRVGKDPADRGARTHGLRGRARCDLVQIERQEVPADAAARSDRAITAAAVVVAVPSTTISRTSRSVDVRDVRTHARTPPKHETAEPGARRPGRRPGARRRASARALRTLPVGAAPPVAAVGPTARPRLVGDDHRGPPARPAACRVGRAARAPRRPSTRRPRPASARRRPGARIDGAAAAISVRRGS